VLAVVALFVATAPAAQAITVPFPQREGSLNPYDFELGYPLVMLVYDSLAWRDAAGDPQPWLAERIDTSGDGREVTVRLRRGSQWHDGRALTSADVAFTFRYVRERFHPRFTPQLANLAGVETRDRRTVVFRLRHPAPGFVDQPLADLPILPRHRWRGLRPGAIAPDGLAVGSGPYRLASLRSDGGWVLTANSSYFRGPPTVDRIEVPIEGDADRMLRLLRRGRADALPVSLAPGSDVDLQSGVAVARGPLFGPTVLLLNTREPPFDDLRARQAVAGAVDPRAVSEGAVAATAGIVHPQSRWAPTTALPPAPRRPLDEVEVPVLAPSNDPLKRLVARRVAQRLRGIGARARVVTRSRAALGEAVGEDASAPGFRAAIWTLSPLSSHDPSFLRAEFASDGPLNRSGYASREFDDAAGARDVPRMLRLLASDAPVVPLYFMPGAFAYRPEAHANWTFVKGTGIIDKQSFLAVEERRQSAAPPAPATAQGGGLGVAGLAAIALGGLALAILVAVGLLLLRR
jgi:peptide/nickel transport system substrate-binding protein